jgi:hypothetical protein
VAATARTPVPTLPPEPTLAPTPEPTATPETEPTEEPEPTSENPTPTPQAEPVAGPAGGAVIAEFTFTDAGIWGVGETEEFAIAAADGTLNILVKRPDRYALTYAGLEIGDFLADVNTTVSHCTADDSYGLLFRFLDASNFYYFGLGCSARFRVRHLQDGQWNELIFWTASDAVQAGEGAENRLAVRAVDDRFEFYANDRYLAAASDSSFAEGQVGLFASASAAGGVMARFDNLQVREASPP